ncbi:hypothetical protein B0H16DRAFT_1765286 [Mycena metata]|uniref:HAT C-terminal dimerisation domain-containing protein n=1 Tax=Mycena metata TaxID=1033252 RepID=A0AAD7I558_9AGAR|nr:hypothetical protein B0H16DRAFT_1765286 [Mycena metata]
MAAIDEGTAIARWFTNHSRALGLLKEQEKATERFKATHQILTLIFPIIPPLGALAPSVMRWTGPKLFWPQLTFFDYTNDRKEFSAEYMGLEMIKQMYEYEGQHVNVAQVWERLDTGAPNGRNGLTRLAIWLSSLVTNSAGSEHGFSKSGIILTKLRTQLSIQKVRKMQTLDADLKRKHDELGMKTDHIKQQFTPTQSANMDYEATESFAGLSTQLVRGAEAEGLLESDAEEENSDDDEEDSDHQHKQLFQYPTDEAETLANGLGFYWQGGVKDLQEELELYDLLMEDDDD